MKKAGLIFFIIGVLNIAAHVTVSMLLGGDAVAGKVEGGRYFVGSHGDYAEVSESIFAYSKFHTYSMVVTHVLGVMGLMIFGAYSSAEKFQVKSRYKKADQERGKIGED